MNNTNLKPGSKILVAVPLDPADDRPIRDRKVKRESVIESITDNGIIHETEGSVRSDRVGIDWEPMKADADGEGIVVKTSAGAVLGTLTSVRGNMVEVYSEQHVPPGIMVLRASDQGLMWDYLKGRTVAKVGLALSHVFSPNLTSATSDEKSSTEESKPQRKKRGPKPKVKTDVIPDPTAEPAVAACDVDPRQIPLVPMSTHMPFALRARLHVLAQELASSCELGDSVEALRLSLKIQMLSRDI